jgi:hypothetical protein
MAITQAVCDSFKVELLEGEHDFAPLVVDALSLLCTRNLQL